MNKTQLVAELAKKMDISQREAKVIVDTVFEGLEEALIKGEKVELRDFGIFFVKEHKGFSRKNPRTGETIEVPRRKSPRFKEAKALREFINKPNEDQSKSQ